MIQTLADALAKQGYETLTPVQDEVTNPEFEGKDLLVSAQTGSGKTVGFGLAIGPTILTEDGTFGPAARPLALVIAPTRELALQVKRELQWLYAGAGVTMASCVGGMDMRDERRTLERGAHIVVATPGRLKDHVMRGSMDMSEIRAIVLDEADEMLDLGFREDLEFILGEAPETRRTLMFSATVPAAIAKLAKSYQKNAVRVQTVSKESQHTDIEYRALNVANHDIDSAIINTLRYYDAPNAIVFCNTRAMVTRLTTRLSNRGFQVVALSGELSQQERSHALQAMRDGRARVCVATDVAARGIDLPNLELVVHAELPTNAETLLHRSGRTGRAGRKGVSALIVPAKMKRRGQNLLTWGKLEATWATPPSADDVVNRDRERLLDDPIWAETFNEDEVLFAGKLLELHAPETIAAAYLRLYAGKQSAPEDLSEYKEGPQSAARADRPDRSPKERKEFGPSKWFSVDVGREGKAEARWLLPMICTAGGITKSEIGAIRIQPNETFVEISEPAVAGFLKSVGKDMSLENQAKLTALDGPPQLGERGPRVTKRDYDDKPRAPRDDKPRAPREERAYKPRDTSTPPPSAQENVAAIEPMSAEERRAAKPRHKKSNFAKPERRDHGDAVVAIKKPYKARDDESRPAYKGKSEGYKGKADGAKPAYKGKSEGYKGKSDDAKPAYKGKSEGYKGKSDDSKPAYKGKSEGGYKGKSDGGFKGKPAGAASGKPKPKASDTSKRFVPPGGKPAGRAAPKRSAPKR
ncbi:MAG: DEAD/DEAH box helicase [Loktanella sp.]|nr:DEAD/DEAH box helicase [Loktanella sp.]MDO7608349.1 DEAD/DEAH box helicase [Loktanella sp.]MDO7623534.1 DEAD/DEAH box helicase [Loktanella sp.]MDO7627016.1 DEAD/DEAH box helicase [Loktanella sp.]MDO7631227.1 DEAD/DEAH box helicase [Loktanella sp.]